jgi:hypothetical protein
MDLARTPSHRTVATDDPDLHAHSHAHSHARPHMLPLLCALGEPDLHHMVALARQPRPRTHPQARQSWRHSLGAFERHDIPSHDYLYRTLTVPQGTPLGVPDTISIPFQDPNLKVPLKTSSKNNIYTHTHTHTQWSSARKERERDREIGDRCVCVYSSGAKG